MAKFLIFFIKHRVVFTIMVRINDNVYTVVKKFNNDANMIKKNNKMGGISFKYSRGECQKLDEKYRLSTTHVSYTYLTLMTIE